MITTQKPFANHAQIHRLCCDLPAGATSRTNRANRARWELYIVVYNTTDSWPAHQWPVARRYQLPTITERTEALARLGYAPAPDAEWEWQETETPDDHGHPAPPCFLGSINIVPLGQTPTVEDGDV